MSPPYFVVYAQDNAPSPPAVADLKGFNVVNLAFLQANGTPDAYSQSAVWQAMSASARTDLKASYAAAGIKLLVSVFGGAGKPTTSGADAKTSASAVAQWVKTYDMDGVDVDYEDFDAMDAGKAEQWVIDFTTQLHSELGDNYLITHAPIAAWFAPNMPNGGYRAIHQAVGTMINWYNVQFYNNAIYEPCEGFLHESGGNEPQTSVFEINTAGQVPLEKIVIGKPAIPANTGSGFTNMTVLASCLQEATQNKWTTGIMFWKYLDSTTSGIMQQARGSAFPLSN
ncbi:glycoside hydrolase family 18 protein [Mycena filopes]|nr:glycoside hydrolase family 18 protein [Mycena filopes]